MKIHGEYTKQLNPENKVNKPNSSKHDFKLFLEKELTTSSTNTKITSNAVTNAVSPLPLNLQPSNLELNFMQEVDNLLTLWENYSQSLTSDGTTLKDVYALLKKIQDKIQGVKQNPFFSKQPEHIQNILKEVEIMATTEEIKINRGDYL